MLCLYLFSKNHGPASIWEHQTRNVVTKTILYKRYREVLFQKVALGYVSHFVHNIWGWAINPREFESKKWSPYGGGQIALRGSGGARFEPILFLFFLPIVSSSRAHRV